MITLALQRRNLSLAGVRKDAAAGKSERFEGWEDPDPFLLVGDHMESMRRNGQPVGEKISPQMTADKETGRQSYSLTRNWIWPATEWVWRGSHHPQILEARTPRSQPQDFNLVRCYGAENPSEPLYSDFWPTELWIHKYTCVVLSH